MMHFIEKAKQTEKDLRARFADDKFAERCTQWKNLSSS